MTNLLKVLNQWAVVIIFPGHEPVNCHVWALHFIFFFFTSCGSKFYLTSCGPFHSKDFINQNACRDRGATLRLGGGGTISDSILGGAQDIFSFHPPTPPPPPLRGPWLVVKSLDYKSRSCCCLLVVIGWV